MLLQLTLPESAASCLQQLWLWLWQWLWLAHAVLHLPAPACRYIYLRHNASDGMVVPYHPAVLLAWGAHVNIQRVTNTSWSFYILKYAGAQQLHACAAPDTLGLMCLTSESTIHQVCCL
jgi:hypothetical protein